MDFKLLGQRLIKCGLPIAEESAEIIVKETLAWLGEEVIKTENKYDDLLVALIPIIEKKLLEQVDKIDGEEG